ncbi:hypothetical protein TSOC_004321 [Tetrabaena socialis]|uniref:Uncharacterized protein n=1 Tax=Tetrabaena socialis TaxID=47790 RepID=A0A2J8A978_9CHLO|nr:hypothetical protein TSOC_004321 [Tetrabaena socialis]|eukprot:PNH09076.1 hypothetical protein TSOC_004321 [Tetrabaena socialis]
MWRPLAAVEGAAWRAVVDARVIRCALVSGLCLLPTADEQKEERWRAEGGSGGVGGGGGRPEDNSSAVGREANAERPVRLVMGETRESSRGTVGDLQADPLLLAPCFGVDAGFCNGESPMARSGSRPAGPVAQPVSELDGVVELVLSVQQAGAQLYTA